MLTETKMRNRIFERMQHISSVQISELDKYLKTLEKQSTRLIKTK